MPLVLVVEDDDDSRDLYVTVLQSAGYAVREAASLAAAREVLAECKPDVVVADYTLPDGTGPALLHQCAEARPRVFILITGHDTHHLPDSGFDVILTKPVHFEQLLATMREHAPAA